MHAYCTQAVTRMPTHRHTPRGNNEGHNKYAFCSHLFVLLNFACGLRLQDPSCVCFGNFNIHLKWKPFHHILPLNWVQQLRLLHPSCHLTQKMTTLLMVWLATSLGASTRAMIGPYVCNSYGSSTRYPLPALKGLTCTPKAKTKSTPTKEWPMKHKRKKGLPKSKQLMTARKKAKRAHQKASNCITPAVIYSRAQAPAALRILFILKPMLCCVKCTPHGDPIFPLQVCGLAPDNAAPSAATTPPAHMQQQGAHLANWAFKSPKIVHQT
jgi:hypothetical protein